MNEDSHMRSGEDVVRLVGEIYRSILAPENFVEILELWDRDITSRSDITDETLNLLDSQIATAVPLLENSFRDIVSEDELVNRLNEEARPSLLISSQHIVVGSNEAGRSIFNMRDGDRFNDDILESEDKRKFSAVMRAAEKRKAPDEFEILNLATKDCEGNVHNHLVSLRVVHSSYSDTGYIIISGMELVLSDRRREYFKDAFGLTDAEMQVVDLVLKGNGQKNIAEIRGSREDTVKQQLRSIRDKTQCKNITSLVCLIASFSQMAAKKPTFTAASKHIDARIVTNNSNQTYTMPSRHRLMNIDGRNLEYVEFGDMKLRPLLIMHASMIGFTLPLEFRERLNERGYRIILPYRPGYGVSERLPEFSGPLMAACLTKFIQKLNLKQFAILGGTIGFIHSAELASRLPEKVVSIIGTSSYLPIKPGKLLDRLPPLQRSVLNTVSRKRGLAKFLILGGYKLLIQFGAHKLMSNLMKDSPADLKVINNSASLDMISIGLRASAAQGVDSLLDDSSLVLSDWKQSLENVKQPIKLIHGDDDSVFPLPLVEEFCEDFPNISVDKIENCGQLMIYCRPVEIADRIADFLDATWAQKKLR